jgi:hypothetical protein
VSIVDDPEKGITDDNITSHMGDGPCKHLEGDTPGEYSCKVHHMPWYKDTPCYAHGQIEKDQNCECRTGRFMLDNQDILRRNTNAKTNGSR